MKTVLVSDDTIAALKAIEAEFGIEEERALGIAVRYLLVHLSAVAGLVEVLQPPRN